MSHRVEYKCDCCKLTTLVTFENGVGLMPEGWSRFTFSRAWLADNKLSTNAAYGKHGSSTVFELCAGCTETAVATLALLQPPETSKEK